MKAILLSVVSILLWATACNKSPDPRDKLTSTLRDSVNADANPQVGYLRDSAHLLINFDTTAFADRSDSAFALKAKDIANFALRHYANPQQLDSLTITARYPTSPGVWRVTNERTFAVSELR